MGLCGYLWKTLRLSSSLSEELEQIIAPGQVESYSLVVVSLVSCSCPSPLPVLMQAFLIKCSGTQTTKTRREEEGGSGKEGFNRKGKGTREDNSGNVIKVHCMQFKKDTV